MILSKNIHKVTKTDYVWFDYAMDQTLILSTFRYSVHKTARIVSKFVPEVYQYRFSHDGPYSAIPQPSYPPGTLMSRINVASGINIAHETFGKNNKRSTLNKIPPLYQMTEKSPKIICNL